MDRGAWWAAVLGVAKSRIQLKRLSTQHAYKIPGTVKFIESESTLVDAGAKHRGVGNGVEKLVFNGDRVSVEEDEKFR